METDSMGSFGGAVWKRDGSDHLMSKNAFAFLVALFTASGIFASGVAAVYSYNWPLTWYLLIGTFVIGLIGVIVALSSDVPLISGIGYAMVAIPFGLMLGPVVALYTIASVAKVFFVTCALVVILGFIGAVYPASLESWGIYLFGGLTALIVGQFGFIFLQMAGIPVEGALTWMDWIGVILFSGYVIYDMNRAMSVERTLDNAVDCALAVYLDFINLFIRLLSIMGQKKD